MLIYEDFFDDDTELNNNIPDDINDTSDYNGELVDYKYLLEVTVYEPSIMKTCQKSFSMLFSTYNIIKEFSLKSEKVNSFSIQYNISDNVNYRIFLSFAKALSGVSYKFSDKMIWTLKNKETDCQIIFNRMAVQVLSDDMEETNLTERWLVAFMSVIFFCHGFVDKYPEFISKKNLYKSIDFNNLEGIFRENQSFGNDVSLIAFTPFYVPMSPYPLYDYFNYNFYGKELYREVGKSQSIYDSFNPAISKEYSKIFSDYINSFKNNYDYALNYRGQMWLCSVRLKVLENVRGVKTAGFVYYFVKKLNY